MVSITCTSFSGLVLGRIVALGLAVLAAAPAFAARPRDPVGSLEQKEFFRPDLYISTSHQQLDAVLGALPNKGAWDAFIAGRGGAIFGLVLYGL